jgi:hypothetical protein
MNNEIQFWITTAIAIYGAAVATWLGVIEVLRNQPRIKIYAEQGYCFDTGDKASEPVIFVEAVNIGSKSVNISSGGWLCTGGEKIALMKPYMMRLPYKLDGQRKCLFGYAVSWFNNSNLREKVVGVYFRDEVGRQWKYKVTEAQRNKWLNMVGDGWRLETNSEPPAYYKTVK